jgi:hypothetical protein
MGNIGIFEVILVLTVAITVIAAYVFAIKKIINSKMTSNQKISWILGIFFFNFLGLIIFMIYHEFFLSPALRGNL